MSAGLLLLTPRHSVLFADGRYTEIARRTAYHGVEVRDFRDYPKFLAKLRVCCCEGDVVTLAQFGSWKGKFKNTKFVQKVGVIEEFRRSKDAEEQKKFRRAQRITRAMLARVPRSLRQGISEKRFAHVLAGWACELGADGLSFEPIVAFGTHSSRPHHRPTDRRLRKGQIVQVDAGARYGGYCADQSAVFFTGTPTKEQRRTYEAVERAKEAAKRLIAPGVSTHTLDSAAREVLSQYGLEEYFVHSLGHGVGLEIHEGVTLSARAPERRLLQGEIITIEPGVYREGKFGIRLEEEVIVQ